MFQLGSYDILREIHRSPQAILYAARRAGDGADTSGNYAVKVFDADSVALLESVAVGSAFIERATLQKRLADQGARHWAPVLEVGDADAAWYAAERFPLTAQRVVNRQADVGERGLYTVVWSVVRGLTELRETFRRAHGNLKLANVLIGGDERLLSPKTTRVVLTDPSVEATSARDRSADLLAIGELIHRLVLRQPFRPDPSDEPAEAAAARAEWPVPMSSAWAKLGPNGPAWLELCNWLLNPVPADRPSDLVDLAVALHRLAPRTRRVRPKWVALAAAPVVLAGAAVGAFWAAHASVRADLQAVEQQWFAALERGLADPARGRRFADQDDVLRGVAATVRDAGKAGVRFDVADDPVLSLSAYRNAKAALAAVRRVEETLAPGRWPRLARVDALRLAYEGRGWSQPAAFLATLVRDARPGPGVDLPGGLDRLLAVSSGKVNEDAGWLESAWAAYDADLRAAEGTGDPALVAFARRLREAVASSVRLTDAGFDDLAPLRGRLPLAGELAKLAAGGWPGGVDRARLAAEVEPLLNMAAPTEDDARRWLAAVGQYALVPLDPKAEPVAGLNASMRKLEVDVAKQALSPDEQAQYGQERAAVEGRLEAIRGRRFVRKDVDRGQGEPMALATAVRRDLDLLRKKWVRLDDPKEWIAHVEQPLTTGSTVLRQRWDAYVNRHRDDLDALARAPERFKAVKAQAQAVRELLAELDRQFPPVPPEMAALRDGRAAFVDAAWDKREGALRGLTAWAVPRPGADPPTVPEGKPLAEAVEAQGRAYAEWCRKLRDLARDFPIGKELLSPADRPDAAWAARDAAFWEEPIVRELVRADVARIGAVAAVARMGRAELARAARQARAAEVAVAAYRRLGEPADGAPAWPASEQELADDLEARRAVWVLLRDGVRSDAERTPAAAELYAQGPVRWRRAANLAVLGSAGAATPADLERRIKFVDDYRAQMHNGQPGEPDKLDPVARFNLALYEARFRLTDPTNTSVRVASTALARAVAALKDRAEVRGLGERLARVEVPEPMSADVALLAPVPPAAYTLAVRDGFALKFARVEPAGGRPFYLATNELSLGQFVELVNVRGGSWADANALLGNLPTPGGAGVPGGAGPVPHRGPRAWERPGSPDGPIERFDTWRYDPPGAATRDGLAKPFAFAPSLRQNKLRFGNRAALAKEVGDNPRYDHPMQQLPAQAAVYAAALADCRLPTVAEWRAAYERELAAVSAGAAPDWNLRDRTWRDQAEFAAKEAPGQWPDSTAAGVFWPKALGPPSPGTPRGDDRTLFFRPVNVGGGTFQNLVGNVAEFACDEADALDVLPDRKSAEGARAFCKAHGGRIVVIGGSALSAPDDRYSPTEPYPAGPPTEPYADVGVRLAFTAPARSTAERLRWLLQEQPYLAAARAANAGGAVAPQ